MSRYRDGAAVTWYSIWMDGELWVLAGTKWMAMLDWPSAESRSVECLVCLYHLCLLYFGCTGCFIVSYRCKTRVRVLDRPVL
jgi:hypothetical protein